MRVVTPYKPFVPESREHLELGPFDWEGAIRMLRVSVRQSCGVETLAITDRHTPLEVPRFRYATSQPRLMLWLLEVMLAYLESDDFDQDTIMISPDTLIVGDIRKYFVADLTLLVRSQPHYAARPILNAVQWWKVKAKARLVKLYREALAIAVTLPEDQLQWGADTEPLRQLLSPIEGGVVDRDGLSVWMLESTIVMQSLSAAMIAKLEQGERAGPFARPIADFKYTRKKFMAQYFVQMFGAPA